MTLPSSLNMFTSSIAWIGWTFSFLREVWSFLSSVPDVLWTFLTFLRGVPLPLFVASRLAMLLQVSAVGDVLGFVNAASRASFGIGKRSWGASLPYCAIESALVLSKNGNEAFGIPVARGVI